MENTYQDLITDIQSKNPKISKKLEGGIKFKIKSANSTRDFCYIDDIVEALYLVIKDRKIKRRKLNEK